MKDYKPRPNWNGQKKWMKLHDKEIISCCDCGLAHEFSFKTYKGNVWWRAKREKKVTKKNREKYKLILVK